jgi:hypothetical protein
MKFEVKKLENCFANAENYEYLIEVNGQQFAELLAEQQQANVRVNNQLRRPTFIAQLTNGIRVKGILAKPYIRVGYLPESYSEQKAHFEAWLLELRI